MYYVCFLFSGFITMFKAFDTRGILSTQLQAMFMKD